MEWIEQLLQNSTLPFVTAFLLGVLTAISPCPLATNITAVGYIGKDIGSRHAVFYRGALYTLGRIVTYSGIGIIVIPLLREGASVYFIQQTIGKYGDMIIAPLLILGGLFMLFGYKLNITKWGYNRNAERVSRSGNAGALALGILFALAFCPTSGVLYFGMLIPLAAKETGGYLLPLIYALGTALPVLIIAWILAYSVSGIGRFYNNLQRIRKWMNTAIAVVFIGVGLYYLIILWQ
ncbi:MAG: aromatic aminobenezylarsenical efflux permease ArsG family transporter [Marinifilaceae bacterium]